MIIQGDELVAAAFAKAATDTPVRAGAVVEKHTKATVETMKQLVPKDRPALVHTIEPRVFGTRGLAEAKGSSDPRAIPRFVEYGTYKDAPQPFVAPAGERQEPLFYADLEKMAADV